MRTGWTRGAKAAVCSAGDVIWIERFAGPLRDPTNRLSGIHDGIVVGVQPCIDFQDGPGSPPEKPAGRQPIAPSTAPGLEGGHTTRSASLIKSRRKSHFSFSRPLLIRLSAKDAVNKTSVTSAKLI
jgi:hypothetical protein